MALASEVTSLKRMGGWSIKENDHVSVCLYIYKSIKCKIIIYILNIVNLILNGYKLFIYGLGVLLF